MSDQELTDKLKADNVFLVSAITDAFEMFNLFGTELVSSLPEDKRAEGEAIKMRLLVHALYLRVRLEEMDYLREDEVVQ